MATNKPRLLFLSIGYIVFLIGYYYLAFSVGNRDECKIPVQVIVNNKPVGTKLPKDLADDPKYGAGIAGVVIGAILTGFGHLLPTSI